MCIMTGYRDGNLVYGRTYKLQFVRTIVGEGRSIIRSEYNHSGIREYQITHLPMFFLGKLVSCVTWSLYKLNTSYIHTNTEGTISAYSARTCQIDYGHHT